MKPHMKLKAWKKKEKKKILLFLPKEAHKECSRVLYESS